MKKKIFAVALVVMMLGAGLVLMSCSKCPGDGDCYRDSSKTPAVKWCGSGMSSGSDLDKAIECAAWGASLEKKECDC